MWRLLRHTQQPTPGNVHMCLFWRMDIVDGVNGFLWKEGFFQDCGHSTLAILPLHLLLKFDCDLFSQTSCLQLALLVPLAHIALFLVYQSLYINCGTAYGSCDSSIGTPTTPYFTYFTQAIWLVESRWRHHGHHNKRNVCAYVCAYVIVYAKMRPQLAMGEKWSRRLSVAQD